MHIHIYIYITTDICIQIRHWARALFWIFDFGLVKLLDKRGASSLAATPFLPRSWWFCAHPKQQHCKPTALKAKPKKNQDLKRATCEEHGIHFFSHDVFRRVDKIGYMPTFYTFLGTNKCCLKGGFPLFSGEENSSPSTLNHPPATCPAKKLAPPSHRDRERERFKGREEIIALVGGSQLGDVKFFMSFCRDHLGGDRLGIFLMDAFPAMAWGTKSAQNKKLNYTLLWRNEV